MKTDINIPNYPLPGHPSNGISKTTIEYTILYVNELDVFWDKNILSIQIKGCHFEIWNQGTKGVQSKQAKKMTGVNLQLACLGWCRENQPMSTDERKTAVVIFY